MKQILTLFILLLPFVSTFAQQFSKVHEVVLPVDVSNGEVIWLDYNNDGLLDNIIFATNTLGAKMLLKVKGDTVNPRVIDTEIIDLPGYEAFVTYDYDGDNDIDILVSTSSEVFLLRNIGETFSIEPVTLPQFTFAAFGDVDHDGKNECILSGHNGADLYTRVYSFQNLQWQLTTDTLDAELTSFQLVDLDKDGWKDVFMSGRMDDNTKFATTLICVKSMFNQKNSVQLLAKSVTSDIDADGSVDIIAWGTDNVGTDRQYRITFGNDAVTAVETLPSKSIIDVFAADLNSDGKPDQVLWSRTAVDSTLAITFSGGAIENLISSNVRSISFGDMEHDGDLDFVQLTKDGSMKLSFYQNETAENVGPTGPPSGIAVRVYNHLLMYWDRGTDDHTPQDAITYDVRLESSIPLEPGEFDLANERRLTVSQGNNGNVNYKLIRDADRLGNFGYMIQAVDNSLHTGDKSTCIGSGFQCLEQNEEVVSLCSGEMKKISAEAPALWFSLKDGYLGTYLDLNLKEAGKDTVFSLIPNAQNCAKLTTYLIKIDDDTVKRTAEMLYRCVGDGISLDGDGYTMTWSSNLSGSLGTGSTVQYTLTANDNVLGKIQFGQNCLVEKEYTLTVSKPPVSITPSEAMIAAGGSVMLTASGATSYEWEESEGLTQRNIPNPTATPSKNTVYTVVGKDSIGCVGTATAFVKVEGGGFLPSLFTPNADGKNDELRVYGLDVSVSDFLLIIANRSGSTVFKTNNVEEAKANGWDGSTNGVKQPNGVYYWRIEGTNSAGEKVVLNGKRKGSILLLR